MGDGKRIYKAGKEPKPATPSTFKGNSVSGKFAITDGLVEHSSVDHRVRISFTMKYKNGTEEHIQARLKSNHKFHCENTGGYVMKASMIKNLQEPLDEKKAKYYAGDMDTGTKGMTLAEALGAPELTKEVVTTIMTEGFVKSYNADDSNGAA